MDRVGTQPASNAHQKLLKRSERHINALFMFYSGRTSIGYCNGCLIIVVLIKRLSALSMRHEKLFICNFQQ